MIYKGPAAWLAVEDIAIDDGGRGLITGPVKAPTTRYAAMFFRSWLAQVLSCGDGPATRSSLYRNTASIMKV